MSVLLKYVVVPKDGGGVRAVLAPEPAPDELLLALRQGVFNTDEKAECNRVGDTLLVDSTAISFWTIVDAMTAVTEGKEQPLETVEFKKISLDENRLEIEVEFDMTVDQFAEAARRASML
jgi:hypothetical protein